MCSSFPISHPALMNRMSLSFLYSFTIFSSKDSFISIPFFFLISLGFLYEPIFDIKQYFLNTPLN
jgi:hypothetical protein